MRKRIKPVHPGEILASEFLEPMKMSRNAFAKALGVPAPRVNDVVLGRRGITADTALRLSAFIGTTPEFWLNLQSRYDLNVALGRTELAKSLRGIKPYALSEQQLSSTSTR